MRNSVFDEAGPISGRGCFTLFFILFLLSLSFRPSNRQPKTTPSFILIYRCFLRVRTYIHQNVYVFMYRVYVVLIMSVLCCYKMIKYILNIIFNTKSIIVYQPLTQYYLKYTKIEVLFIISSQLVV